MAPLSEVTICRTWPPVRGGDRRPGARRRNAYTSGNSKLTLPGNPEASPFRSPASKLNRVSYQGLILDFGGVVTTDLFAELSGLRVRESLEPGAFARVLRDDQEGRHAFEEVEAGKISQREFEVIIGRLLGVDHHGLLTRYLAACVLGPEILNLIQRTRGAGQFPGWPAVEFVGRRGI